MNLKSPVATVLLTIVISTLFRLVLAKAIGLGVDESYVVSIARSFSLSYFDHPPLHFWIIWLTAHITGSEDGVILRLPFITMFAATTWMMYRLGSKLFNEWAGAYAALLLNISAVFSLSTGSWILPDGPLMFLMMGAALVLIKLFFEPVVDLSWKLWLLVGVLTGLGMLAKYHAVFMIFGSLLFVLTTKEYRKVLVGIGPYLAVATAVIIFLPVLLWNQEHHWISFLFQSGRGIAKGFYPLNLLKNIGGQAAWVLPWIWIPLVWVLIKVLSNGQAHSTSSPLQTRQWFLCCLGIGPILLFTIATLWGAQGLFHWQAPGYLFAMPLLGHAVAGWVERGSIIARVWLSTSMTVFLLLVTVLGSHTATGWMRQVQPQWFQSGDPTIEALDWQDLAGGMINYKAQFIVAPHWIDAGKIDYALGGGLPVLCLNNQPHHFAYLHTMADYRGKDALIVGRKDSVAASLPNIRRVK
ncbi:glycosyltransferase family 39 protein [bacterium BFN5]|nr:glycosyltransferase family 39 protein [bacterium BFN5]